MIKSYIKNEKIISYEIIYKPIKHVYFRKTQTHILISANNKMSEKSILNILDINFDKIYKLQTKSPRLKTNKFQLWGENVTKESYFDNLSPTEDNYKKILINETLNKIKEFEPLLIKDLSKLNLSTVPTKVKLLKSKFGSCHTLKKDIIINGFLAKLDPKYLYYVLLHEYCHLLIPNHSKSFYECLDILLPNHKLIQKQLRKYVISF